MGMIYKRGNVWWIKYYRNGKQFRESSKSTKKMVAKKLLDRREGEIAQGKLPAILFDKVIFDELAEDFLRDYRINKRKSLKRATDAINHLKEAFEGTRIVEITSPRIEIYKENRMKWMCNNCKNRFHQTSKCPFCFSDDLTPGAANATINRELSALKRMLNLGARQTPPKVDRVPYIAMLKENNVKKGFFEHADFLALRNHLPDHLKGFVTFCYKVGWRESEVTGLTWSQVDRHQGIVRLEVGDTKNNEGRTVYLDNELKAIFKHQWELRKKNEIIIPYVFTNHAGKDKIHTIRRSWNTACIMTGIGYGYRVSKEHIQKWEGRLPKGPTLHDFRRTAVRNSIRAGIPERVAMTISGHKTRSVFDRYNIVNDDDLKKAAKAHEEYLLKQEFLAAGTISGTIRKISEINSKQRIR
jgi:integrase